MTENVVTMVLKRDTESGIHTLAITDHSTETTSEDRVPEQYVSMLPEMLSLLRERLT